ncbi:MAG: hypothetical protein J4415_02395 [Candidatus Diapherotrites archaeon]|uniref:Uncharacterized protein n=1 Tax=Candidatus Iainarchaeum sp. TaxID=3101447 RepID=A0A8T4L0U0_9ARCH|nr:hypothetical protein [Candidatus Diapherotrites archaeon]
MKAVFEIKDIKQDWQPPFKKSEEIKQVEVSENEEFEADGDSGFVFRLIRIGDEYANVQFNRLYTIKGHEHPNDRTVRLQKQGDSYSFSALWNANGVTKKLKLIDTVV